MDGWYRSKWRLGTLLGALTLVSLSLAELRAEPPAKAKALEETAIGENERTMSASADGRVLLNSLKAQWETVRDEMRQVAVEVTVTAFFIRGGTAPPKPKTVKPVLPDPPAQGGGGPPVIPPPPPPPPDGANDSPVLNPPPPQGAPEPASLVTAMLGASGLASWLTWRKRRKALPPSV